MYPTLLVSNMNINGLLLAAMSDIGIALLPDYLVNNSNTVVRIPFNAKLPEMDTYMTYAEERKKSKRVSVLREFLVEEGRKWSF